MTALISIEADKCAIHVVESLMRSLFTYFSQSHLDLVEEGGNFILFYFIFYKEISNENCVDKINFINYFFLFYVCN